MAGEKRTAAQREADLTEVARLMARGLSGRAIAAAMNRPVPTVARDVKAVLERWQKEQKVTIDAVKARELVKLDEREALIQRCIDAALEPRTMKRTRTKAIKVPDDESTRLVVDAAGMLSKKHKHKVIPLEVDVEERTIQSLVPPAYFTALAVVWRQRARFYGYEEAGGGGEMPDMKQFFDALAGRLETTWADVPEDPDDDGDDDED